MAKDKRRQSKDDRLLFRTTQSHLSLTLTWTLDPLQARIVCACKRPMALVLADELVSFVAERSLFEAVLSTPDFSTVASNRAGETLESAVTECPAAGDQPYHWSDLFPPQCLEQVVPWESLR